MSFCQQALTSIHTDSALWQRLPSRLHFICTLSAFSFIYSLISTWPSAVTLMNGRWNWPIVFTRWDKSHTLWTSSLSAEGHIPPPSFSHVCRHQPPHLTSLGLFLLGSTCIFASTAQNAFMPQHERWERTHGGRLDVVWQEMDVLPAALVGQASKPAESGVKLIWSKLVTFLIISVF